MCLLLETIRIENGRIGNIRYHQERMNRARQELFKCSGLLDLDKTIRTYACSAGFAIRPQKAADLQSAPDDQKKPYKCRVTYAKEVESIEFLPYKIPSITSLKMVIDDEINYTYKFNDRSHLNELFEKRAGFDDILIVKQGFITDTSYANVLFYNGKEWLTPTYPLLKGTQRASLLDQEIIRVAEIRLEDLHHFIKVRLINAMIRFEDELDINILNIRC